MKLVELLQSVYKNANLEDYFLGPKELTLIKDQLLQCDEFKGVDKLIIMNAPNEEFKNEDNSTFLINSFVHKFYKNTKFKGTCYLYCINLSPVFYNKPLQDVKNNVGFIPKIVDSKDYNLYSKIIISIPEYNDTHKNELKTILSNLINDLDNLKDYSLPEERSIMLRGFFLQETPEPNSQELVIEDNVPVIKPTYKPEGEIIILK